MPEKIQAVKGMNDILPPDSARWEWFESKVRALMARYGYANVRTPIVEPTALFVRGLGEVTDIVEKEMYSFEDRLNGEQLTLRPENTAGVVRAVMAEVLGIPLERLYRLQVANAGLTQIRLSDDRPATVMFHGGCLTPGGEG